MELSESVNDIRNIVMHAKNLVKYKNYDVAGLIYNIESFKNFFKSIILLQSELRKVTNKNNYMKLIYEDWKETRAELKKINKI